MTQAWQTIEEAALTLGISSRTLHRRMARSELQTRLDNGRREVLVDLPDPPSVADTAPSPEFSATVTIPAADSADDTVRQPPDHMSAMADNAIVLAERRLRLADLAVSAFQQAAVTSAKEVRRARTGAAIAWSTVGGLGVVLLMASAWMTHRVTEAHALVRHSTDDVRQLADTVDKARQEADTLRQQSVASQVAAAKAEGQLQVTAQALAESRKAATRPATALEQLAAILSARPSGGSQASSPATQPSAGR